MIQMNHHKSLCKRPLKKPHNPIDQSNSLIRRNNQKPQSKGPTKTTIQKTNQNPQSNVPIKNPNQKYQSNITVQSTATQRAIRSFNGLALGLKRDGAQSWALRWPSGLKAMHGLMWSATVSVCFSFKKAPHKFPVATMK